MVGIFTGIILKIREKIKSILAEEINSKPKKRFIRKPEHMGKKIIIIQSHTSNSPVILDNGDKYDSEIIVLDENDKEIYFSNHCNVDSSVKLLPAIIEIENGEYDFIVGKHKGKYLGLLVMKKGSASKYNSWEKAIEDVEARTLACKYPNPKYNGKKIVKAVNVHAGGDNWDWSEGCITIIGSEYFDNFINNFVFNEIGVIIKM